MTPVSGSAETQQRLPAWDIRLSRRQMIITYGPSAISHQESMPRVEEFYVPHSDMAVFL